MYIEDEEENPRVNFTKSRGSSQQKSETSQSDNNEKKSYKVDAGENDLGGPSQISMPRFKTSKSISSKKTPVSKIEN
jgi:hypothetical protein